MKQGFAVQRSGNRALGSVLALSLALAAQPVLARDAPEPEDLLPSQAPAAPESTDPGPAPATTAPAPGPAATPPATATPVVQQVPDLNPVMDWSLANAHQLLGLIEGIAAEGLIPADYRPEALRAALAAGEGDALNTVASQAFTWLAEDLRDGRTPVPARVQWFALDPDRDLMPTDKLMATALESGDVAGVLGELAPTHPDYLALKEALANTPRADKATRALIQANMDRWRWLAKDLGKLYLFTNVPEFMLRVTKGDKPILTYRTVVGKPGRTATPQLAETVEAVVFNPTWTVPQSIVVGEGLGARVLGNPRWAAANGYKGSKGENGYISVVQQPGPGNALGMMKIDMPNPHAIYLHDTPAKSFFDHDVRAYSHGCIRTERAVELGMALAIFGAGMTTDEAKEIHLSRKYTRVVLDKTVPVYITYFTMGVDVNGNLRKFGDIYDRDKPVLESFTKPRVAKTAQRISDEEIIELDNPL